MKNYLPKQYSSTESLDINHNYLKQQFNDYEEIFKKIKHVVKKGDYTLGEEVDTLEKEFSKGKFGKGDTSISQVKNYKLQDDESDAMLDVKLKVSKKLDDAMTGFTPKEAKKVFDQCMKELCKIGLVKT